MLRKQSNQCQRGTEAARDGNIDKVQKGLPKSKCLHKRIV